jgi:hypothetical protein
MLNRFLPWILLGLVVFVLLGIGIKSCNKVPDANPYQLRINELESKLYIEKSKSDSAGKKAQKWEKMYLEEAKKPKKIIIRTNEKLDSIKHLSLDSSIQFFQQWTNKSVDRISE